MILKRKRSELTLKLEFLIKKKLFLRKWDIKSFQKKATSETRRDLRWLVIVFSACYLTLIL